MLVRFAWVLVFGCLSSCTSPESSSGRPQAEVTRVTTPRFSSNRRALYATPELQSLARDLVGAAESMTTSGPPKIALYYFTLDGRQHFLGEAIAQDLSTLMVNEARGRIELFTRRKLGRVTDEMKRQLTPMFDRDTLVQVGRLSGVDAILSGQLIQIGDRVLRLNAQILNVSTSEIVGAANIEIPLSDATTNDSVRSFDDAVSRMAGDLEGAMPSAEDPWRVAIYDITRGKGSLSLGKEVAESIASELVSSKTLTPLTRSALDQVIEEQSLQSSRLFEEETRAEIARLVGGNAILTGFCEYFATFYLFNIQVIDVETAQIHAGTIRLMQRRR